MAYDESQFTGQSDDDISNGGRYTTQPVPVPGGTPNAGPISDPTAVFGMPGINDGPQRGPIDGPQQGPITTQPLPRVGDASTAPPSPYMQGNNPLFDRIAGFYTAASGGKYKPTQSDVSQWGTNVDANYLGKINQAVTAWWKQQQGAAPAATPGGTTTSTPQLSAADFIKQYQGQHTTPDVNGLLEAMKAAGYNVAPYMYGQTPSGNEISLDGQKYKVRVDGGGWWEPSMGEGGAASGGTGFADPAYNQLAQLAQNRLRALGSPFSFPGLDEYMKELQGDKALAQQRAQDFAGQLSGRVAQLQQPLLSQGDVATQRALASNSLLASRDAALRNQREKRFASGFEPTSGLLAGDERAVNEQYNNRQGQIDAQLQSQMINTDEHRRNEATQLQGLIAQALRGGDLSSLQNQATSADLENQLFNIDQNRQREMLTTGNVPVDLTNMGFANASSAANASQGGMSSILQLLNLANGQQGLQQQQSAQNMQGTAFFIQMILKALGGE